jgi:dTDP-4-dehydrorhamnose 3,5-epimerase
LTRTTLNIFAASADQPGQEGAVPLNIDRLGIEGLLHIQPRIMNDERGNFIETFHDVEYARAGIAGHFVQDNQSLSRRGVLRGLHFQRIRPQGKLVRAVAGEVFDVAVDLRPGSPTFGRWEGLRLSGELQNQVYLPPGLAHGFLALSEIAIMAYKCTEYYDSEIQGGIRYDDPILAIAWPESGAAPILSERDRGLPSFDPGLRYF